jgi:ABC-type nitrate/sulfonate/bicarbonate transport system substrate-binding protein
MTKSVDLGRRNALKLGGAAALSMVAAPVVIDVALAAVSGPPINVRIANTAGNTTLVLQNILKTQGYFEQFGLKPDIINVSDGSKLTAGLIGGDADVCMISGFSSLLPAIEKGAKLKVLCGAGTRVGQCLYSKRPDIKQLKDLEGKTFGCGAIGALLHEITVAMLRKHGIDETKVKFVNVGSSTDVFKAIVAGTVDAGCAEIDNLASVDKYGIHALSDGKVWEQIPEYLWQAGYTADRAIAEKREGLVRTLAAFGSLYRFLVSPKSYDVYAKARAAALGQEKNNEAEAKLFWNFVQEHKGYAYDLVVSKEQIDYVQNLNVSLGVQKKMLPFEQVADMSIAKDALKLMGA